MPKLPAALTRQYPVILPFSSFSLYFLHLVPAASVTEQTSISALSFSTSVQPSYLVLSLCITFFIHSTLATLPLPVSLLPQSRLALCPSYTSLNQCYVHRLWRCERVWGGRATVFSLCCDVTWLKKGKTDLNGSICMCLCPCVFSRVCVCMCVC